MRSAWRCAAALAAGIVSITASEAAFRACAADFGVDRQQLARARRHLLTGVPDVFEPRAHTVFQRPRSSGITNSLGFSDLEWELARTPGSPRILCIGGSTTEGGNGAGRAGSYPYLVERKLQVATRRDFEVMNAGISGWTTAEAVVAWYLTLQDFRPDVVIVHFAINDVHPRLRAEFRTDYSHWRKPLEVSRGSLVERLLSHSEIYLQLRMRRRGIPDLNALSSRPGPLITGVGDGHLPPETALAFRRNVQSIAEGARAIGASVALMTMPIRPNLADRPIWVHGVAEHNRHLRELCAERGYLLVDAERVFAEREDLDAEFLDVCHLTPEGNRAKAAAVAQVLFAEWLPAFVEGQVAAASPESGPPSKLPGSRDPALDR